MRKPLLALGLGLVFGSATTAPAAERSINKEIVVDASVEQVWQAWTTRAGIVSFFARDASVEARVGGRSRSMWIRSPRGA